MAAVEISPDNQGLLNLERMVDQIKSTQKADLSTPIVLVSGFSGWGEALFGTFNYWGGFEDLPAALENAGYNVIVVRIGPLSSNWERACEVYAQLSSGVFDTPEMFPPSSIPIDYGAVYPARYGYNRYSNCSRAVLYGNLTGWKWSISSPVHCICHSQGGNTVRLLIELLGGTHPGLHPTYFVTAANRQNMVKSVVTMGTPHKGTTITDVVQNLLPPNPLDLITQFVVSVSFKTPRFYDLQLDHWGFGRLPNESFNMMFTRIRPIVQRWWYGIPEFSPHNGFYDNSILGVTTLNNFAIRPAVNTFYFTMSFDATIEFPNENVTPTDLASFPVTFPLSLWNPLNIPSNLGAAGAAIFRQIPGFPSLVNIAKWAIQVANNHLGALGYFDRIPTPGPRVPRSDMLPLLLPTSYAMGGHEIPAGLADISSAELQPNDGVVNTISMRGPSDIYVADLFPLWSFGNNNLPMPAKGTYWHLGINKTMDHGDQIGVFTVGQTYAEVNRMYLLFAELLTYLPSPIPPP